MSVGDVRTLNFRTVRSGLQNIDNGAGTTYDEVIARPAHPYYVVAARIVYEEATSGTAAAATYGLGTSVGAVDVVAATALENSKAVGSSTAMTVAAGGGTQSVPIAANTPLCSRYTGVAATVAGAVHVEVDIIIVSW